VTTDPGDREGAVEADVRRIRPDDRAEGPATPGMVREEADRTWGGLVRTAAGMVTGWHHHGDYESTIYVMSGALRMEFGPGGASVVEAAPGDFVFVAAGVVHRESNPSDEESRIVVVRAGSGVPIVNVAGPS
jgi:uncharacterized RmlC-like cupin family protein